MFTAEKTSFMGEDGYSVKQYHDGRVVTEQFVSEEGYNEFCRLLGDTPKMINEETPNQDLEPDLNQVIKEFNSILKEKGINQKDVAATMRQISATGQEYKGRNLEALFLEAQSRQYADNRWMTFKQIQEKGYKLRKGSKSVRLESRRAVDKTTGKFIPWTDYDRMRKSGMSDEKMNVELKTQYYGVFNASCIDGIEGKAPEQGKYKRDELIQAAQEAWEKAKPSRIVARLPWESAFDKVQSVTTEENSVENITDQSKMDGPTERSADFYGYQVPLVEPNNYMLISQDVFDHVTSAMPLSKLNFSGCCFRNIDFREKDLRSMGFDLCLLENCKFDRCNLSNLSLFCATVKDCTFNECSMEGIDLKKAELSQVLIRKSSLGYNDFDQARIHNVDFDNIINQGECQNLESAEWIRDGTKEEIAEYRQEMINTLRCPTDLGYIETQIQKLQEQREQILQRQMLEFGFAPAISMENHSLMFNAPEKILELRDWDEAKDYIECRRMIESGALPQGAEKEFFRVYDQSNLEDAKDSLTEYAAAEEKWLLGRMRAYGFEIEEYTLFSQKWVNKDGRTVDTRNVDGVRDFVQQMNKKHLNEIIEGKQREKPSGRKNAYG